MNTKKLFLLIFLFILFNLLSCNKINHKSPSSLSSVFHPTGTKIITNVPLWQTIVILDRNSNDITQENMQFVGLATYNSNNRYEFFDLNYQPKNDYGDFFITDNGLHVIRSEGKNYFRILEITELTNNRFTYKITNDQGQDIWVVHKPI